MKNFDSSKIICELRSKIFGSWARLSLFCSFARSNTELPRIRYVHPRPSCLAYGYTSYAVDRYIGFRSRASVEPNRPTGKSFRFLYLLTAIEIAFLVIRGLFLIMLWIWKCRVNKFDHFPRVPKRYLTLFFETNARLETRRTYRISLSYQIENIFFLFAPTITSDFI